MLLWFTSESAHNKQWCLLNEWLLFLNYQVSLHYFLWERILQIHDLLSHSCKHVLNAFPSRFTWGFRGLEILRV